MFILCDKNNKIVDMATREENLSRGYEFDGHELYKNVDKKRVSGAIIGDSFDGVVLAINDSLRFERAEAALVETKIRQKLRRLAVDALKSEGELPADYKQGI